LSRRELSTPPHFDPGRVSEVWRVSYQGLAEDAARCAEENGIRPFFDDEFKICLVAVDVQNTFCIPGFELFVGGRSGTGAVDDNRRLCEFIYKNVDVITRISPTMDTHRLMQIFHSIYLVNDRGEHPAPFTLISEEDIRNGAWKFNPLISPNFGISEEYGQKLLHHYAKKLRQGGKYDLTVWPYHAMLGGLGHALVASFEEAVFFHAVARHSQPDFYVKGEEPFTEHYSVLGPEVLEGPQGESLGNKSGKFYRNLLDYDALVIAGQAKSHCVAWTVDDLLHDILDGERSLAEKVYILEDCTSPVVIPGVVDYTDQADAAFRRFASAGMHVVRSTDPIATWPGIRV